MNLLRLRPKSLSRLTGRSSSRVLITAMHCVFVVILTATAVSCNSLPSKDGSEWSPVALVDGRNSTAQNMVRSTLKRSDIVCFMEGSVGYAVMVPKNQLAQAKRVLQEDSELRNLVIVLQK
jgi:hypothetical protein